MMSNPTLSRDQAVLEGFSLRSMSLAKEVADERTPSAEVLMTHLSQAVMMFGHCELLHRAADRRESVGVQVDTAAVLRDRATTANARGLLALDRAVDLAEQFRHEASAV